MADRDWPSADLVRSLISQLDEAVNNAARVRREVETQMRRRGVYPDRRRQPRHWERLPDDETTASGQD